MHDFLLAELENMKSYQTVYNSDYIKIMKEKTITSVGILKRFIHQVIEEENIDPYFLSRNLNKIEEIALSKNEFTIESIKSIDCIIDNCSNYINKLDHSLFKAIQKRVTKLYNEEDDSFNTRSDDLENYILNVIANSINDESDSNIRSGDEFLQRDQILKVLKKVKKVIKKN